MSRTILCLSFVTSPIVTDHSQRANTFLYSCTFSCHSHLSLSLFSSSFRRRATECWIKRRNHRCCCSNFSKQIHSTLFFLFLFFFFFLFNSFQHLLLVISCLPLRSCLPRSAPSITRRCSANSKKGDDAEKRISKGATRSNCNFVSGKYCAFSGRDGLCCGGKLRETERFHPSPSSQCRSLLS